MSDDSEPVAVIENAPAPMSHRRILLAMVAVTVGGGFLGLTFISWHFGAGILFGGALSLVNYYWLKKSLAAVFEKAVAGEKPRFLAGKYFLRYAAFGAVLLIVFLTKALPVISVLLGLASFAFAIVVEALILLFASFFKK